MKGAKFTPSSFLLTKEDILIYDMNTRQIRVLDLDIQKGGYLEKYAGEYTVYSKDKSPRYLSGNEGNLYVLGDKVRQHK